MLKKLGVIAIVLGSCTSVLAVGCSSSSDSNGGASDQDSGGGGSKKDGGGTSDNDGGLTGRDGGGDIKDSGTKDSSTGTKTDSGVFDTDSGTTTHLDAGADADAGPVILSDGGTSTAPACYDVGGAVYYENATAAVANQNKCNATQVNGYYTACLDKGATATTCNAYRTANATCDTCIEGAATGTYAFPAVAFFGNTVEVSYMACYAALSAGNAACKVNVPNEAVCVDSACDTCTTDADACQDYGYADGTGCSTVAPVDTTCAAAVNAASAIKANQTKCGSDATTFQQFYTTVTTTLCGP